MAHDIIERESQRLAEEVDTAGFAANHRFDIKSGREVRVFGK